MLDGAGILNLLGIDYSLRPRLSTRLTLGGRTFPRKPWDLGELEFNQLYLRCILADQQFFQKILFYLVD